jgi:hypothetical protein
MRQSAAMSEIDIGRSLFNWGESELPADKRQTAFEQYKLFLDLTDRLSQRRQTASSFFVTVTTAVAGILGYARSDRTYIIVSVTGLILCALWWRIIRSYRDLTRARFEIIYAMETLLPLKPYTAEWDFVGRGVNSKFYRPVSGIEAYVPLLFFVLFACVLLWTLLPHFL